MNSSRYKELALLLLGDIVLFYVALWLTLTLRYLSFPTRSLLETHLIPFSLLFIFWIAVFFIAGLYDKHTVLLKKKLPGAIVNTQVINIVLSGIFFLAIPYFGITPKTNLAIYLIISSALIIVWRLYVFPLFWHQKKQKALLIGEGPEVEELVEEVNNNNRYEFEFVRVVDFDLVRTTKDIDTKLLELIDREKISIIVADSRSEYLTPFLPLLFNLTFLDLRFTFIDLYRVYENIFDRVPLSALRYNWFLEHVPMSSRKLYDVLKRVLDIIGSLILAIPLLVLMPLVWLATKLSDGGSLFIVQERMGQYNRIIHVYKFRTMRLNKSASSEWTVEEKRENPVTRVGAFLRKTSLDELPQVINILRGDMSLIGPRNDIMGLGSRLAEAIPYYNIRYIIKPGITGWAQTHQMYSPGQISPQSIEDTQVRLAYDLYYIKNRSLFLDINIALRTAGTLISRFGVNLPTKLSSLYAK